jgi:hypothetical protein
MILTASGLRVPSSTKLIDKDPHCGLGRFNEQIKQLALEETDI